VYSLSRAHWYLVIVCFPGLDGAICGETGEKLPGIPPLVKVRKTKKPLEVSSDLNSAASIPDSKIEIPFLSDQHIDNDGDQGTVSQGPTSPESQSPGRIPYLIKCTTNGENKW